jgi:hypothetical protein
MGWSARRRDKPGRPVGEGKGYPRGDGSSDALPGQAGRDAFHCVPEFSGEDGDAVERVPTRFMAGKHVREDEGTSHDRTRAAGHGWRTR